MRKALKKLSGPKNLVRRVLSKSSLISQSITNDIDCKNTNGPMTDNSTDSAIISQELESLKDQVANLKAAICALQNDTEQKEIALAKLARDKEKVYQELLKQKRTNASLVEQLEDERKYYYKEKEIYCQEMNEYKKLKRVMSSTTNNSGDEKCLQEYKKDISKLKQTLNQTLEANYNLSVKFLRMKNTKTCMKTELKKMQLDHEKLANDLKYKIEGLSSEVRDLVADKLNSIITPSSKKYLQLVKQNSCLVYENLCLQLEVDKLNLKFDRVKINQAKHETNSRLKYINHSDMFRPDHQSREHLSPRRKPSSHSSKHVRINVDAPEKLEKEPQPSCSHQRLKDPKIVKIFERTELPGIPSIEILNENELHVTPKKKNVKLSGSKVERSKISPRLYKVESNQSQQVSEVTSNSVISATEALRVKSAPEIVQSTRFINTT